jgi:hypothetical protein
MRWPRKRPTGKAAATADAARLTNLVLEASTIRPVVVAVWSERDPVAAPLAMAVDRAAANYDGAVEVVRVDTDANPELAGVLGIADEPAILGVVGRVVVAVAQGSVHPRDVDDVFAQVRRDGGGELAVIGDPSYGVFTQLDPFQHVAGVLARTEDPVAGLAVVITHLLRSGRVAPSDLTRLGIVDEEAAAIVNAFDRNDTLIEIGRDLDTQAAVRHYRSQVAEVAAGLGIVAGSKAFDELQHTLASFAHDNDIDDLRIAYRLLRAEQPERRFGP